MPEVERVFLMDSKLPIPLHLAVHGWFVIQRGKEFQRWEFGKFGNSPHPEGFGLHRDLMPPFAGMNKYPNNPAQRQKARVLGVERGEQASLLAEFIESRSHQYPGINRYQYTGPNSNTYVQWVLGHFPQTHLKLPWNAFGKNYRF